MVEPGQRAHRQPYNLGGAPLISGIYSNPTGPTPTIGDNDTSLATTAFVTVLQRRIRWAAFRKLHWMELPGRQMANWTHAMANSDIVDGGNF
jgi:hypothetical protein